MNHLANNIIEFAFGKRYAHVGDTHHSHYSLYAYKNYIHIIFIYLFILTGEALYTNLNTEQFKI